MAADEDRDGRLHRLRVAADRAEAEVLAVEGRLVLLPDHAQRVDGLVGAAAALVGVDAEGRDLLAHPADADAEEQAAAGEAVDGGAALGELERVVLREHEDAGAEPDPLGAGGQPGQQVERIGQLAVLGQRHAAGVAVRVAALVADRHRDVLDREQRLEADLVGVLREGAPSTSGSLATPSRYGGSSPSAIGTPTRA